MADWQESDGVATGAGACELYLARVARRDRAGAMGSIMFALSGIFIGKLLSEHYIEQMQEAKNR